MLSFVFNFIFIFMEIVFWKYLYYLFLWFSYLFSITFHEYAHAWCAYKLWDSTPLFQGRLSLNPFKHISVLWLFSIFFIWFWWWKPVLINSAYFKSPERDTVLVSLAWPFVNLLIAIIWVILMLICSKFISLWLQDFIFASIYDNFVWFLKIFIFFNISLFVFNILPFPPLDWFSVIRLFFKNFFDKYSLNIEYISLFFLVFIMFFSNWFWNFINMVSIYVYNFLVMLFWFLLY